MNKLKHRFTARRREEARYKLAHTVINQSRLFDPEWYLEYYPDVAMAGLDPLEHFIRHGAQEGRNPSARFDLRFYLKRNPDVARTNLNPLFHYLTFGRDEGRSIRPVGSTESIDSDLDMRSGQRQSNAGRQLPKASPYSSDFRSTWRARQFDWAALSERLNDAKRPSSPAEPDVSPVDWLATRMGAAAEVETPENCRIRLFEVMRRDSPTRGAVISAAHPANPSPDRQYAHKLLVTHGLGADAIIDGWFACQGQLTLRLSSPHPHARRLRAFQYNPAGEIICCAQADVTGSELELITLNLDQELCPVLLTWQTPDGALAASTLLPFPSLLRGGLHHSEIAASEAMSGERPTWEGYMAPLALQAYCWGGAENFAIKRIMVDLACANGSEPLFRVNIATALAAQFGIELRQHPSNSGGAASDSLGRLLHTGFGGPRTVARMAGGDTLILPADGFPSLACLAARSGQHALGFKTFCVVVAGTRQPMSLICHPAMPSQMDAFRHPALPLPYPMLHAEPLSSPALGQDCGAPIMIRFHDAKVWRVDEIMPVSPDSIMPPPAIDPTKPQARITVIIDDFLQSDRLPLCIASLANQTLANDLDLVIVGAESASSNAVELFGASRACWCLASGPSRAERLNQAASLAKENYLLFLDSDVCMPDPRTLSLLLEIACTTQAGSVSCAIVREDIADGSTHLDCAGIFSVWGPSLPSSEGLTTQSEILRLFPASAYPVFANSLRLCLLPSAVWRDLGGLSGDDDVGDGSLDIDFGLRARLAGLQHFCTTQARAVSVMSQSVAPMGIMPLQGAVQQDLKAAMSEQTLRIRELLR
ncbi:hypothetical protein M2337_002738 [Sphingobium sp. B2D3A]|uniref:glycosyltransferase family 2 protein n=1 Tax=unclassified Sphingobium TaxID=2611147 RepID=UPI0022247269|nr:MULTISPECIES: glycosyltransferase [unclassified Sphingobium]MCW2338505.1 hypothetical protein [Sphingobium sp. B2D3A]MCW2384963.1 hypothetical protein [Sphingobium sp. B2D3D]